MKFLRSVYWSFLCIVVITVQTVVSNAQNTNRAEKNLKIRIDFQSAQTVVDLLERNRVTNVDLNRVAGLFGNLQLVRKVAGNKFTITTETKI